MGPATWLDVFVLATYSSHCAPAAPRAAVAAPAMGNSADESRKINLIEVLAEDAEDEGREVRVRLKQTAQTSWLLRPWQLAHDSGSGCQVSGIAHRRRCQIG